MSQRHVLPTVGIATRGRDKRERFSVGALYVDAVRRARGLPILLPPEEPALETMLDRIDGLLLTGGGDVDPARYQGAMHERVYGVDASRDETEIALARAAVERSLPVLGICRGAQVLNVALGGTLFEHLPEGEGELLHRARGKSVLHAVHLVSGSRLRTLLGKDEIVTHSYHHQAIRSVGRGLEVVAHAPDGVIEAVELSGHPFAVGVQWHPEMSAQTDPTQQRLFDAFVGEAARFALAISRS